MVVILSRMIHDKITTVVILSRDTITTVVILSRDKITNYPRDRITIPSP